MAKAIMTEQVVDPLLKDLGKAAIVVPTGFETQAIKSNDLSNLKVSFLESKMQQEGVLYSEVTTLKLEALNSSDDVYELVNKAITTGQEFTNHFVKIPIPEKATAIQAENLNQSVSSYDIVTNFNYLSSDYDELQMVTNEPQLPPITFRKSKQDFVGFIKDKEQSPINYSIDSSRYENFVVPNAGPNRDPGMNSSNVSDEYPYYNEIKITNKVDNNFSDFIIETQLFDALLNAFEQSTNPTLDFVVQEGQSVTTKSIEAFEMLKWANSTAFLLPDDMFPLDPNASSKSTMINKYKKLLFAGYVRSLSKGKFRSFEEVYNNEMAYREDFVYKVQKFRDTLQGAKAQNIYIPAVDDTSLFNDSQIKYGQQYVYKCDAYYIIVGNRYRYENLRFNNMQILDDFGAEPRAQTIEQPKNHALVDVVNVPSVVIVPFHLFTESVIALMPPPIEPQVKFVTENNSNNKIQVYLSPTKGEKIDSFIQVTPSDMHQEINMNMNSMNQDNKTRFKYSNQRGKYEIFRTKVPPKYWSDFQGKKLTNVQMTFLSNSARFEDTVIPNTKYYYMFRKVNVKGLVSNPTAIYGVELIKDADDSKIMVSEYEFPKPVVKADSRKFKNLFQLYPSYEQTWFDESQPYLYGKTSLQGTVDNLNLGIAQHSVWGRKFKVRVKSTTSGKIIDYNITFKLTKNKTEEDF